MRKIEQEMVAAIKQRRNWKSSNTAVEVDAAGALTVRLHGHAIAQVMANGVQVKLSACGWYTVTTKSRLNAVIDALFDAGCGIYQSAGEWSFRDGSMVTRWEEVEGDWMATHVAF
jgi:hypothetical protein